MIFANVNKHTCNRKIFRGASALQYERGITNRLDFTKNRKYQVMSKVYKTIQVQYYTKLEKIAKQILNILRLKIFMLFIDTLFHQFTILYKIEY